MLDKLRRQPVLSLQQHQSIVNLLPLFDSQPRHKLAKVSAKCYNHPFHTANIQKLQYIVTIQAKYFTPFIILYFRLEFRAAIDVNRWPPVFRVSKGMISLQTDRGTSYEGYRKAMECITSAYKELREELSSEVFGKPLAKLSDAEMQVIYQAVPMNVSEAEPKDIPARN